MENHSKSQEVLKQKCNYTDSGTNTDFEYFARRKFVITPSKSKNQSLKRVVPSTIFHYFLPQRTVIRRNASIYIKKQSASLRQHLENPFFLKCSPTRKSSLIKKSISRGLLNMS